MLNYEERPLIEKQIQEFDEYPLDDPNQQNQELKRLFRITSEPSFKEVRSLLLKLEGFKEQHSVLALLLSWFDELPYLACLFPLLKWTNLVSSALTLRVSRKEVQEKDIHFFIHRQTSMQEKDEEDLTRNLKSFMEAWNKMREFVDKELTGELGGMPFLTEHNCKVGYCLTEGDMGIYLRTAINILQSIQNRILDEMIFISTSTRHPALSFLEKNDECCAVMSVAVKEAKEEDIINFNWSHEFLHYAHSLEYGKGEYINYDFERMEKELANEVALGKCYLLHSPSTFIFSKELFHSRAQMLLDIRNLCPQKDSLPEEISLKHQNAAYLLQNIEVVIFLLNKQSVPIESNKTLEEFVEIWKSKLTSAFQVDLLPEPRASLKLCHIAPLYEALEDLLADGTIGGLPEQFRVELPDEASLNCLVDSRKGLITVQQFLTALRRFVFRYLSAEKFLPEAHTPLCVVLDEPSLWSPGKAPERGTIPGQMMLKSIYAIITNLEQKQKRDSSTFGGNSRAKRFPKKYQGRHGRNVSRS